MHQSILRFLLSDKESLAQYQQGDFMSFEDIRRRLFLLVRDQNRYLPDHYYRLNRDRSLIGINSISEIWTDGLPKLVADFLELDDKRIYVLPREQNAWQELITFMPPLLLQAAYLYRETVLPSRFASSEIVEYYRTYILPNTRYTALPGPRIPQLLQYASDQKGFHDLHMHLNGTIETDLVWQDYLARPELIYKELQMAFLDVKVKEQLEQESSLLEPLKYFNLLKTAQKLRHFFFNYLFKRKLAEGFDGLNKHQLLGKFLSSSVIYPKAYTHPFLEILGSKDPYFHTQSLEALMYILLLDEMKKTENEMLAAMFHFYLLILGLTNRLLVQQVHQNGFEQFQKHTLNGLREESEREYVRRFFQLHGNDQRHIRFLEGRFSPKKSQKELKVFIDTIWKGWDSMKNHIKELQADDPDDTKVLPELGLIAHFIKKDDKKPDHYIRHNQLRKDNWHRAKVLSLLINNQPKYKHRIVAVDAAASEFDAPPEVFAPVFRLMRRSGIKHFTYHAGEDFYHIVSGLRVIYEAITFCGLKQGDRIGHATATAISTEQWHKEVGAELLIRRGEYLDNLVFAYHMIITYKLTNLEIYLPFIIHKAEVLANNIYRTHYSVSSLEKAWQLRRCCPFHLLNDKSTVASLTVFDTDEWYFPVKSGLLEKHIESQDSQYVEIFRAYHNSEYRKEFNEIISVKTVDIFGEQGLESLQLAVLDFMNKREIVIETLPTSNVRIGFHRGYETYHLWNWICWKKDGKSIPPIVVGSDDTGIFATNIYNEYANIYCMLVYKHHLSHNEAISVIKKINEDSQTYKFK